MNMIKIINLINEIISETKILYFAYGSNMDVERMKKRCPDAKKLSDGTLHGWDAFFDEDGVASIKKSTKNDYVNGVVWEIKKSDIKILDKKEGVKVGDYKESHVNVKTPDGIKKCLVYIALDKKPGKPKKEYVKLVKKGEKENKIKNTFTK